MTNSTFASFKKDFRKNFVSDGLFQSAIVFDETQYQFILLSHQLRELLPPNTRTAGYPNMNLTLLASGYLPVTFMGNYFGDEDRGLSRFIADLKQNNVDCLILNRSVWPYPENFSYFPAPEKLIFRLKDNYTLRKKIDFIDIFCVDGYKLE